MFVEFFNELFFIISLILGEFDFVVVFAFVNIITCAFFSSSFTNIILIVLFFFSFVFEFVYDNVDFIFV